jgi:NADPH-dependent 2,4-dienoyl-CoA reductase/sulfur reductase-like enzyme
VFWLFFPTDVFYISSRGNFKVERLVIIGGSDAGISAALRAREVEPAMDVTVVVGSGFPNYSICGLPFYLSGEVQKWQTLAHRSAEDIQKQGIRILLETRATGIDSKEKTVSIRTKDGLLRTLEYDKLIVATGASSIRPPVKGLDMPGVHILRWMEDGLGIRKYMEETQPKSAIILGSGYIAMEMADALTRRGLSVTVISRSGRILKTVDPEMGEMIRRELSLHGVQVIDPFTPSDIQRRGKSLIVEDQQGTSVKGDMVLAAVGAQPETTLAKGAGIETGIHGAIRVNHHMETNIQDIYAAGDCAETWHRLLDKYTYLPLGTTAHKQGRIAGENAAGNEYAFAGSLGTQVVKIFDIVVARTGLLETEARASTFHPLTIDSEFRDHKDYYPGATPIRIRITGDRETHRLLGAQMIGNYRAEISKRIDILATAIFNQMTVESLTHLDLSYTPPLSSPWDPVQSASQAWMKALEIL